MDHPLCFIIDAGSQLSPSSIARSGHAKPEASITRVRQIHENLNSTLGSLLSVNSYVEDCLSSRVARKRARLTTTAALGIYPEGCWRLTLGQRMLADLAGRFVVSSLRERGACCDGALACGPRIGSEDQRTFRIVGRFRTNMLDAPLPFGT